MLFQLKHVRSVEHKKDFKANFQISMETAENVLKKTKN